MEKPGIDKSEVGVQFGSWGQRRGEFDLARNLEDSGIAFRVTDFGIPAYRGRPVDVPVGTYYGAANARDFDYSQARVDAMGYYRMKGIDLQLNVMNLFDRKYIVSGHGTSANLNLPGARARYS